MNYDKIKKLYTDFENQNQINKENLLNILKNNVSTKIGRKYHFESIDQIEEFQKKVPLTTYDTYKLGNESSYSIACTIHTTGTTGQPKVFMISDESLKRYDSYIYILPKYLCGVKQEKSLHTSIFRSSTDFTILSSAYYHFLKQNSMLNIENFVEGEEFLFSDADMPIPYIKLCLSLMEEDLTSIQSIYLYEIDVLLEYLNKNWQQILKDLEKRTSSLPLSKEVEQKLWKRNFSKERIFRLTEIFKENQGTPSLSKIWPKLTYISGIGQKNALYVERLKERLGSIPIYYFSYASSECMCGIATQLEEDEYALLPQSAFYEFLNDKNEIFLPEQVKLNQQYELVITTFHGLYRYRTNDIISITGFVGQSPKFKVLGRKNKILNISGEKIDEWTIQEAMRSILNIFHFKNIYYYIGIHPTFVPARYLIFTNIKQTFFKKCSIILDKELKRLNEVYADLRSEKYIGMPQFVFYKKDTLPKGIKPVLILKEEEVNKLIQEAEL